MMGEMITDFSIQLYFARDEFVHFSRGNLILLPKGGELNYLLCI